MVLKSLLRYCFLLNFPKQPARSREKVFMFLFCFQKPFAEHYKICAGCCLIKKRVTLHLNKIF
jgi:hypothetical protein